MDKKKQRIVKELKALERKERVRGIRGHDAARFRNLQGRLMKQSWSSIPEGESDDDYYSDVAD